MTQSNPSGSEPRSLVSARAAARRPVLGRGLLIAGGLLAVVGIVMAIFAPWNSLTAARDAMRKRMTNEDPTRFLAPGSVTTELPSGRIFVSYLTDTELGEKRHIASAELVFELTVTDAAGAPIAIEYETTQRANLPSSRPGRSSTAVLVGAADIAEPGTYTITLELGENESSEAVADVFFLTRPEIAALDEAFGPVLGAFCGLGGGAFIALLGGITLWLEKRARLASGLLLEQ